MLRIKKRRSTLGRTLTPLDLLQARLRAARGYKPQIRAKPTKAYEAPAPANPTEAPSGGGGGMSEQDMMAMMGFAGFGQNKEKEQAQEIKRSDHGLPEIPCCALLACLACPLESSLRPRADSLPCVLQDGK